MCFQHTHIKKKKKHFPSLVSGDQGHIYIYGKYFSSKCSPFNKDMLCLLLYGKCYTRHQRYRGKGDTVRPARSSVFGEVTQQMTRKGITIRRTFWWELLELTGLNCYKSRSLEHRLIVTVCVWAHLLPTLCDPIDCSPPGSYVHDILPGKNTGVVAISYYRGSSQPRDQARMSCISCIGRWILYH